MRHRRRSFPSLLVALVVAATLVASVPRPSAAAPTDADAALVDAAYTGLLGRTPDADGLAYWLAQLDAGVAPSTVVARIGDGPEQRRTLVAAAYREILGRSPDSSGLDFWAAALITRLPSQDLYGQLYGSPEYFDRSGGTAASFVRSLYGSILSRTPDSSGEAFWLDQLMTGRRSRADIARSFLSSPEAILRPALSIVEASPPSGSLAGALHRIEITLDQPVLVDGSAVLVSIDGIAVAGSVRAAVPTAEGEEATWTHQLVFEPDSPTRPLVARGVSASVVVTVFGYDGSAVAHTDYGFTYVPTGGTLEELMVAYYGHATTGVLGVLGETPPEQALARLQAQAAPFAASGRPVMPVFELIATLVTANPGDDNLYRRRTDHALIQPYLETIRSAGGRLILDIQPGRADFEDEVRSYEPLLLHPEVGVALDPEWVVGPTQTPQGRIGTVDAEAINRVSAYLSTLVVANDLPNKVLIVHRFRPDMVTNTEAILSPPGVTVVFHADGEGSPGAKLGDYFGLLPDRFARGIKLFFDEDTRLMTPAELLALEPQPDFVSYQ